MHFRHFSLRNAFRSLMSAMTFAVLLHADVGFGQGLTWVQRLSGTSSQIQGVAYNGGYFVAVGNGFSLTSPDGQIWTYHSVANIFFYALTYANGVWVAVDISTSGGSVNIGKILTSTDGVTWTLRTGLGVAARDVAYGNGIFVAVGTTGIIQRSLDNGVTWQLAASPTGNDVTGITYGAGMFMAVDLSGNSMRSVDGLFWALSTGSQPNGNSYGVAYGAGVFILTGTSTAFARSFNGGVTWSNLQTNFLAQLNRIRYQNGRFVAVANSAGIDTSIDNGATWQVNTSGLAAINLRDVTYGAGKWVAVGSNGAILTASDVAGVQTVPALNITSAVRLDWQTQSGAVYQVQSSTNLQTWQPIGPSLMGDGNVKLFYDSQDAAQRFYRVLIQ